MNPAAAIVEPLNDAQREAVTLPLSQALVLAGAGSGKTRVLVHRIAWLLQVERVAPYKLLAVTFTNKAANELGRRIGELIGFPTTGLWVGTFHGLSHRLLRRHWQTAGLPEGFQVIDSDDQLRLVKRSVAALDLDPKQWPPHTARWYINHWKDDGLRPDHIEPGDDHAKKTWIEVYRHYQKGCERGGLVDFAELLLRALELLRDNQELLQHYRDRFSHVLVDEFQDTNAVQYAWLRMLAGTDGGLFVVGDDDQSIYGWRGARVENIQQMGEDYPGSRMLRMEQNYRSTGTILKAANALISHNLDRLGKQLWTADGDGDPITLYSAYNDQDEARYTIEHIGEWVARGGTLDECAILYRSNAQSRQFEQALLNNGMPYRVYGGLRFFERAEIKDALCYLRLVANPNDDAAFTRMINVPARGIGDRTVALISQAAAAADRSLWAAAVALVEGSGLNGRARNAVAGFLTLVRSLAGNPDDADDHPEPVELLQTVLEAVDLAGHYEKKDGAERAETRVENLDELTNALAQFEYEEDRPTARLNEFLGHAALEMGERGNQDNEQAVQLMTLHAAKGLEFPLVFLSGMEDGLFPSSRSIDDPRRLEEERRLCYVGITRARRELVMTHAAQRRLYGQENHCTPSRFLAEVPPELTREIGFHRSVTRPSIAAESGFEPKDQGGYYIGCRVMHRKFGEGVVIATEGEGARLCLQINFAMAGLKMLDARVAPLEVV